MPTKRQPDLGHQFFMMRLLAELGSDELDELWPRATTQTDGALQPSSDANIQW